MCCSRCSTSCRFHRLTAGGLLPDGPSRSLAALEHYGMIILLAALLILPALSAPTGLDLNFLWRFVARLTSDIVAAILRVTGAG
jgi:ABC-type transport system involved in cytochrome c biogenesis permease subunit